MTPYADVTLTTRYAAGAEVPKLGAVSLGSGEVAIGPIPQEQLVDFRSGQRISEVAAFAARILMDGLAKWSGPAKISDIRCEVDPGDPSKLNFTYNIAIPFLRFDFIISPPKPIPVTMEVAVKPTEVVTLDPVTLTERVTYPLSGPAGGRDPWAGCPVPDCGRPRTVEFNVAVSEEPGAERVDGCSTTFLRGFSCDTPGHRAHVEAGLRERYVVEQGAADAVFRGKADWSDGRGIALEADVSIPENTGALVVRAAGPDFWVREPRTQADVDYVLEIAPDTRCIRMNPRDLSTYNKSHYAANRVILNDVVAGVTRVQPSKACECGSAKAGLPTHSSWCPRAS